MKIFIFLFTFSTLVAGECKIFDATSFSNKPKTGMFNVNIWHHNWGDPVPVNAEGRWIIDKEDLFMNSVDKVHLYAYSYVKALNLFKVNNPDANVGFYAVIPMSRYRSAPNWEEVNQELIGLSVYADYIYPSLYTFYNVPNIWVKNAIEVIAEAKKYKKKVYPFIWPLYHGANPALSGTEVDSNFFRLQLETLCEHADGVVIWDWRKTDWDDSAAWWLETKEFINGN